MATDKAELNTGRSALPILYRLATAGEQLPHHLLVEAAAEITVAFEETYPGRTLEPISFAFVDLPTGYLTMNQTDTPTHA